jgi:hypothetical protein
MKKIGQAGCLQALATRAPAAGPSTLLARDDYA